MDQDTRVLEFVASPEVEAAAERIVKVIGPTFFEYNVILQVMSDEDSGNLHLLNYMPRKEGLFYGTVREVVGVELSREEFSDFCIVNAAILENLSKKFIEFSKVGFGPSIIYPNTK